MEGVRSLWVSHQARFQDNHQCKTKAETTGVRTRRANDGTAGLQVRTAWACPTEATSPRLSRNREESVLGSAFGGRQTVRADAIRLIRGTGWTFIWLGIYLLGFVAYQLWFTNLLTARDQAALAAELDDRFAHTAVQEVEYRPAAPQGSSTFPTDSIEDPELIMDSVTETDSEPEPSPKLLLQESEGVLGEAFAQIRIPAIGLDATVIEGVRRSDLKKGPGHMTGTPVPGQPGNAVISGHRTTYGAPFGSLNELIPGDRIELDTAIGTHVYEVREPPGECRTEEGLCVVKPTDLWVLEPREGAWLTLTTCHPKFSSRRRLIVFAELVEGPNEAAIYGS